MRRPLLLVLPLLVLTLAGCGQDEDSRLPTGAEGSLPAAPEPSPRTSRPSTPESPEPPGGPPAPPVSPAAPARSAPSTTAPSATGPGEPGEPAAQGDVDGDGEPDEITYEAGEAVVALSGGGVLRAGVEADIAPEDPVTAGVEDLDRDGRAEVFVKVGQGASTGFLLVLRYDGTRLATLQRQGAPLLLAYGGSATHGDGFSCTDAGTLLVRTASSDDGKAYVLQTVTYRVRGDAVVETGRTSATGTGMEDPAVAAAYVVDCRSVGEGG